MIAVLFINQAGEAGSLGYVVQESAEDDYGVYFNPLLTNVTATYLNSSWYVAGDGTTLRDIGESNTTDGSSTTVTAVAAGSRSLVARAEDILVAGQISATSSLVQAFDVFGGNGGDTPGAGLDTGVVVSGTAPMVAPIGSTGFALVSVDYGSDIAVSIVEP